MRRPRRADVAIAVALYAVVLAEFVGGEFATAQAPLLAGGLLLTAPLAWRRAAPLPAVAGSMAGAVALALLTRGDTEPQTPIVVMLVAAYSAGAHLPRREALAGLGLVIAAILVDEPGDAIVLGPVCLGAWLAGRLWQGRERDAVRMAELAEALERERVEERRLAVAEERARIARELHDVVAHAMTTIVLEAGAERLHLGPARSASARRCAASSTPAARRSTRCGACSASCATATTSRRSRPSRGSRGSTSWSSTSAAPGSRSTCASSGGPSTWPRASTSTPTGSCRRR